MLGIAPLATTKQITKAYHELAARYHPDKHVNNALEDLAKEKLVQLNEAYTVLSNSNIRSSYDMSRQGRNPSNPATAHAGVSPSTQTTRSLFGTVKSLVFLILLLATLPYSLRLFKSPTAVIVVVAAISLAWFGPKIIGRFKK